MSARKSQPSILKNAQVRAAKKLPPELEEEAPEEAALDETRRRYQTVEENDKCDEFSSTSQESQGKRGKILDENVVRQRLACCRSADVDNLTCLVEHCGRQFKECLTLAFHLSYSHIVAESRAMCDSLCLLCGKRCSNGRSLSLHAHLSHRQLSVRHAEEMRAISRGVDCRAAANRELTETLLEKSKLVNIPEIVLPEVPPRRAQRPDRSQKPQPFNLPLLKIYSSSVETPPLSLFHQSAQAPPPMTFQAPPPLVQMPVIYSGEYEAPPPPRMKFLGPPPPPMKLLAPPLTNSRKRLLVASGANAFDDNTTAYYLTEMGKRVCEDNSTGAAIVYNANNGTVPVHWPSMD